MTTPFLSIILVRPQLGENIGLTARAMGNFGAQDLRLVSPRDPWPNPAAENASVAAKQIVKDAKVFSCLKEAVEDLHYVFCTTARQRDIKKEFHPLEKWRSLVKKINAKKIGVVFGPEQTGLTNEEVSFCHTALSISTHPSLPSLNLSHAVLLCLYEFSKFSGDLYSLQKERCDAEGDLSLPATHEKIVSFLSFLEHHLHENGFFIPTEKKEKMQQNLRDVFLRRPLSYHDVNTLFGVVKSLTHSGDK